MKTATFIKSLPNPVSEQKLYALSEPLEGYSFVVVSAVNIPYSGPETYIFGADKNGKILHYAELEGSFRGGLNHTQALANAGYEEVDNGK